MKTIELVQKAGPDHVLHLDIPVDDEKRYRLVINVSLDQDSAAKHGKTVTPETVATNLKPELPAGFHAHPGWPAGFWETVFGAWEGEFIRDQGEYEERATW